MDLKAEILYQYPFPIAVTYLNADNAREAVAAHDQRIRLFEVTLKLLASIVIAQYVRDRLGDARVKKALRGLVRPSLGQWNGFLREVLNAYRRAGRTDELFIPELYDAYHRRRQDRPAIARAYNEITNIVQDRTDSAATSVSLLQFCDAMVSYRNKTVGHGVINRYQCEQINEPLFDAMEEMLGQLDFFKAHRLVYIEQVRVRRGSYAHEMMSFMGSTPPARMKEAFITDRPEEYRVEERLYLCLRDQNVPELSLHPLVIAHQGDILFLNESERERDIEYLSYTTGQIKRPDRLIEDFRETFRFVLAKGALEPPLQDPPSLVSTGVPSQPRAYTLGCAALDKGDWTTAVDLLEQVTADDPDYKDAQAKLAQARQQANWAAKYESARTALAQQRWEEAAAILSALSTAAPGYRDVASLVADVRHHMTVPCPKCGSPVSFGYQFCSKCGAPMQSWVCWRCRSLVAETRKFCGNCGAPRQKPNVNTCPRCGHQNPAGRRFCGQCGTLLPGA